MDEIRILSSGTGSASSVGKHRNEEAGDCEAKKGANARSLAALHTLLSELSSSEAQHSTPAARSAAYQQVPPFAGGARENSAVGTTAAFADGRRGRESEATFRATRSGVGHWSDEPGAPRLISARDSCLTQSLAPLLTINSQDLVAGLFARECRSFLGIEANSQGRYPCCQDRRCLCARAGVPLASLGLSPAEMLLAPRPRPSPSASTVQARATALERQRQRDESAKEHRREREIQHANDIVEMEKVVTDHRRAVGAARSLQEKKAGPPEMECGPGGVGQDSSSKVRGGGGGPGGPGGRGRPTIDEPGSHYSNGQCNGPPQAQSQTWSRLTDNAVTMPRTPAAALGQSTPAETIFRGGSAGLSGTLAEEAMSRGRGAFAAGMDRSRSTSPAKGSGENSLRNRNIDTARTAAALAAASVRDWNYGAGAISGALALGNPVQGLQLKTPSLPSAHAKGSHEATADSGKVCYSLRLDREALLKERPIVMSESKISEAAAALVSDRVASKRWTNIGSGAGGGGTSVHNSEDHELELPATASVVASMYGGGGAPAGPISDATPEDESDGGNVSAGNTWVDDEDEDDDDEGADDDDDRDVADDILRSGADVRGSSEALPSTVSSSYDVYNDRGRPSSSSSSSQSTDIAHDNDRATDDYEDDEFDEEDDEGIETNLEQHVQEQLLQDAEAAQLEEAPRRAPPPFPRDRDVDQSNEGVEESNVHQDEEGMDEDGDLNTTREDADKWLREFQQQRRQIDHENIAGTMALTALGADRAASRTAVTMAKDGSSLRTGGADSIAWSRAMQKRRKRKLLIATSISLHCRMRYQRSWMRCFQTQKKLLSPRQTRCRRLHWVNPG